MYLWNNVSMKQFIFKTISEKHYLQNSLSIKNVSAKQFIFKIKYIKITYLLNNVYEKMYH